MKRSDLFVENNKILCQGCDKPFRVILMIPDELWELISEEFWFLCGACIMNRLEALDKPLCFHTLEGRAKDLFPLTFPESVVYLEHDKHTTK